MDQFESRQLISKLRAFRPQKRELSLTKGSKASKRKQLKQHFRMNQFRKKCMEWDLENNKEDSSLVNQCNSNGSELRQYCSFLMECNDGKQDVLTPVLSNVHLQDFNDIEEVNAKLKEMPAEWTVVLVTKALDPIANLAISKSEGKDDPTCIISRLACGNYSGCNTLSVVVPPKGNIVSDGNIIMRLEELQENRRAYYKNHRDGKLASIYRSSDSTLAAYVKEVDLYWLREWKCLLSGRIVNCEIERSLKQCATKMVAKLGYAINRDKCAELLFLIIKSAHHLKNNEILKALKYAFYNDQNYSGDVSDLEILVDELKAVNTKFADELKTAERYPVILVLDSYFELVPWEMTAVLSGNPVTRVPSVTFLYALFKYHQSKIKDGYREVLVDSAFCLLNPSKDLMECEERIGKFLQDNLPWVEVSGSKIPEPEELSAKLRDFRLYLYCGHGAGTNFFPSGCIGKTQVSTISFLYGCCSNLPQGLGGRTPYQNSTYTYLLNGASCIVGALYDVNSTDADMACMTTLSYLFCEKSENKGVGGTGWSSGTSMTCLLWSERDVLLAVLKGKAACKKFITSSAMITRGLPVKVTLQVPTKS